MTKGTEMKVNFSMEKTTPGAVRYMEVDDQGGRIKTSEGAVIGTLYVRKDALNGVIPQKMTVTIKAD